MAISETLEIIIKANNQTQGALSALQKSLGALGTMGKVVGKVAIAGIGIAAGIATAAIAGLGTGLAFAVKEAMEAETIMAQLDAVIASTGGAAGLSAQQISDMATKLSTMTRYEDDAIMVGQNLLLTFTNIGKDIFPLATEAMLDMSTAMGQDLSTTAIQLGKALNAPLTGMTALQRVGVTFTEEQKTLIKTLVDTGDVMGAQKIILAELTKEFGGSAVAAGQTLAGQMDILRNSLSNVAEEAGTALIPVLTEGLLSIAPAITTLAQNLAAFLTSDQFRAWLSDVGTFIGTQVIPALDNFSNWFATTAIPAIQGFVTWVSTNLFPVFQNIQTWLGTNLPPVMTTFGGLWTGTISPAIQRNIDLINNNFKPAYDDLSKILGQDFPKVASAFSKNWAPITTVLTTVRDLIMEVVGWLGTLFGQMAAKTPGLGGLLAGTGGGTGNGLRGGTPGTWGSPFTAPGWTPTWGTPKAAGGPVGAGLSYLVGELGPELFMPSQSGTIVPNSNLGGGGTVIINFNQPVLGFSNSYDLANQLAPIINEYNRKHK
jgi:hypothetical protein